MLASVDLRAAISSAGSIPATRKVYSRQAELRLTRQFQTANPVSCLSVTLRRGRLKYLAAALAAAAALGGCSASAAPATAGTGTEHALTLAMAQATFDKYVTDSTAAAKAGNAVTGLAEVGDAQWAIVHAQYAAFGYSGTPVTQYSYGTPVFYVPALPSYPLWFLVAVPVSTDVGGHLGPPVNTLMAFQRYTSSRVWTLDGTAVLDQPLPPIVHDSDGYVSAYTSTDPSLLLEPDLVGATQARVVDEGPTAPAAAVIGNGPQTTGIYTVQSAQGKAITAQGLNYQWLLEGASFAQYELRTADGGALIMYTMYLNTTTSHPNQASGSPISVPANFAPMIPPASRVGHKGMTANWTYEFAAIDPPGSAHGVKVQVIAGSGGPTYGHGF
jgi:hypothetical protein